MIGYVYLKSNNEIRAIINDVVTINDTDVLGKSDYAKGNDFNLLAVICLEQPITKELNQEIVNVKIGDIIDITNLVDLSPRIKILSKLEELDKIITRPIEQLYFDANLTPSYPEMAQAIVEKQALRVQLASL